jgi:PAP2 superfamily
MTDAQSRVVIEAMPGRDARAGRQMMSRVRLIDLKRFPNRTALERIALTASLTIFFVGGYFGLGLSRNPAHIHEITTQLDEQIPFIASSVWIYLWVFPCSLTPLFVVRCPRLFRRSAIAYSVVIAISFVFFAAYPVTSSRLRVAPTTLDLSHPSHWAVSVVYGLDPPYNLFPSLHLAIAALAAFSVRKATKRYGMAIFVSVGFVGVAVCTVKQHCLLDVFGGLALATLADILILRPYRPPDGTKPAYSWHGPATHLVLVVIFYAAFFVAYFSGL